MGELIIHLREDVTRKEVDELIDVIENHSDIHTIIDDETGWTILKVENEKLGVSLGKYPNKRFDILKKLLAQLELQELKQKIQGD